MLYVNKDKAGEIKMVSKVAVFFCLWASTMWALR